ncbi:hypothetical protein CL621_01345 [archaeon]|nr:hypothetical protein [archaeon]|tara:strand:- start:285 stop:509 length:225 start_codon:yes stop_codon:yes gene_type:complete
MEINKIAFSLNEKFYKKEAIKESLKDFKEVCEGKIERDEQGNFKIILIPKEETEKLKEEFCNYVLGLMKNELLV